MIKEIESRSPYKVVHTPDADSTLSGRIVRETKHVTAENQNDDARLIAADLAVEVRWVNRRGEVLMQQGGVPVPPLLSTAATQANFVPEAGQSLATAQQRALQQLAREIVDQMEVWW